MCPGGKLTKVSWPGASVTLTGAAPGRLTLTWAADALVSRRWMLSPTMPGLALSNQLKYWVNRKVNWSCGVVALVPAGVVTVTSTGPEAPAGLVALIWRSETTVTFEAGVEPNLTPVAPVNPQPVIVTPVPPVAGPSEGTTPATTGGPV